MILLAALAGAVYWALVRRRATATGWRDNAVAAEADGTALHDAAVGELIAAGTANQPERWSAIADGAEVLATTLAGLEGRAPDDGSRRALVAAGAAVAGLRAAVMIAAGAPAGSPLEEAARDTLRERLAELSSALQDLRGRTS